MILAEGYATGYTKERVEARAAYAAKAIEKLRRQTGSTSVVVHGNSGVSCGFAALMASAEDFNLVLLRKDNDNSHGAPLEGPYGHRLGKYLILDDFVSSGATMNRIRDKSTPCIHNGLGHRQDRSARASCCTATTPSSLSSSTTATACLC